MFTESDSSFVLMRNAGYGDTKNQHGEHFISLQKLQLLAVSTSTVKLPYCYGNT